MYLNLLCKWFLNGRVYFACYHSYCYEYCFAFVCCYQLLRSHFIIIIIITIIMQIVKLVVQHAFSTLVLVHVMLLSHIRRYYQIVLAVQADRVGVDPLSTFLNMKLLFCINYAQLMHFDFVCVCYIRLNALKNKWIKMALSNIWLFLCVPKGCCAKCLSPPLYHTYYRPIHK